MQRKTLLIIRHASAAFKQPGMADHDRPLNEPGQRQARGVGRQLQLWDLIPEVIVSSTAQRARQTAEQIARSSGGGSRIELARSFYLAPAETYLQNLCELPEPCQRGMIVGHNPGLEGLVGRLTGVHRHLSPATLAVVQFEAPTWSDAALSQQATLVHFWHPDEVGP